MWSGAPLQVFLLLITGIAAATATGGFSAPARSVIGYAEISPFRGKLHGQSQTIDVLKGIYQRSVTHFMKKAGEPAGRSNRKESYTCYNMRYWIVANVLRQDKPVDFIKELFCQPHLAACRTLGLIFEHLDLTELKRASKKLVPAMDMDRATLDSLLSRAKRELPEIKRILSTMVEKMIAQSPRDFIADHHSERAPKDILAYISLRCECGERPLASELSAVLEAIRARVEAIRRVEDAEVTSPEKRGEERYFCMRMEKELLFASIHSLLNLGYRARTNNCELFALTLNCMASRYSRSFIELLVSSLLKDSTMEAVVDYICTAGAGSVDPYFACDFFAALKERARIDEEKQAEYLHSYYSNSNADSRIKLLAFDEKHPEPLPHRFFQLLDSLYSERAHRTRPRRSALYRPAKSRNLDRDSTIADLYLEGYEAWRLKYEEGVVDMPHLEAAHCSYPDHDSSVADQRPEECEEISHEYEDIVADMPPLEAVLRSIDAAVSLMTTDESS
ncbi:hypothetical protein PAPHI01_1949 [Pancytospora philotis]|nr:hypothetical protein PAPHI01_1949 [Pancytospora philotis]